MKWKDVELVDGEFYFVEVERWRDGKPNNWVFAYKDNNDFITEMYVSAKITDIKSRCCCIYDFGHVCSGKRIVSIRPATREDMNYFWDYIKEWGYKYNLNTKKLRYVGC